MQPKDDPALSPIGGGMSIPPQQGIETEHLTQDLMSALERAVLSKVDEIAKLEGLTRRQAAARVLRALGTDWMAP